MKLLEIVRGWDQPKYALCHNLSWSKDIMRGQLINIGNDPRNMCARRMEHYQEQTIHVRWTNKHHLIGESIECLNPKLTCSGIIVSVMVGQVTGVADIVGAVLVKIK